MKTVTLDAATVNDEPSFHAAFQSALGFPAFYGHNMNAWVDCMGYIDDPSAGMSSVSVQSGEVLVLHIENAGDFKRRCPELWVTFLECAAFVNWRSVDKGGSALISVSAYA